MNPTPNSMQHPITEDDIANFLANTPDFFERHAELLATVQLSSGHGSRAVSLQERQAGMLRDKIRGLESRLVEMLRHGQDNVAIADKMQSWTRQMLLASEARELPGIITRELQTQFQVPQVAIKVWNVAERFAAEDFAQGVSQAARDAAAALTAPFCGPSTGLETVSWLDEPAAAQSVALIALRTDAAAAPFGLLVLASAEANRFGSDMGTDFLQRIGELASAALSRLHGPADAGH